MGLIHAFRSLALDLISSTVGKSVFSIFEPYSRFYKRSVERNSSTFPGGLDALFDCSFSRRPGGAYSGGGGGGGVVGVVAACERTRGRRMGRLWVAVHSVL